MNLEDFVKTYHPSVMKQYERSLLPWDVLKVGTVVVTLRAGFSGYAGVIRKVIELRSDKVGNCAVLSSVDETVSNSLLYESYDRYTDDKVRWWKDVAIIDFEHYKNLNLRERTNYINQLVGFNLV